MIVSTKGRYALRVMVAMAQRGGIIGTRDNAMAQCVVRNSTFHGTVESSGSYAGGIVGGGYDNSTAPNGACPTILG